MLDLTPATFEEFQREAGRGNVVPVVRSVLADLQTPVAAFLRIAGDASHAFLLESIEGGERVARYFCASIFKIRNLRAGRAWLLCRVARSAISAMTPRVGSSRLWIATAPSHASRSMRSGCSFAQSWPSIGSGSL